MVNVGVCIYSHMDPVQGYGLIQNPWGQPYEFQSSIHDELLDARPWFPSSPDCGNSSTYHPLGRLTFWTPKNKRPWINDVLVQTEVIFRFHDQINPGVCPGSVKTHHFWQGKSGQVDHVIETSIGLEGLSFPQNELHACFEILISLPQTTPPKRKWSHIIPPGDSKWPFWDG